MSDFVQRIKIEKADLDANIYKLTDFMHGEFYPSLPPIEQGLLMVQLEAMKNYSSALFRRLEIYAD